MRLPKTILLALLASACLSPAFGAPAAEAPTPALENGQSQFEEAQKAFAQKRYKDSKAILLDLLKKHPTEDFVPRAKLLLANLEEDFVDSTKRFKKLAEEYKGRPEGEEAQKGLGVRLYLADKYAEAAKSYQKFLQRYPHSSGALEARYWLACSLLAMNKDQEAARQFQTVEKDSKPDSPWAPKALAGVGNAYLKMKKYDAAKRQYLRVLDKYYSYDEMNLVYLKLGQSYEGLKKPREARAAYQTLLDRYPKAFEADEAKERIAALENESSEANGDEEGQPEEEAASSPAPQETASPGAIKKTEVRPNAPVRPQPFHVQIGVYTRKANVEKAKKDMEKAGYNPMVEEVRGEGIPYACYKVKVGSFADKRSAEKFSKKLAKQLGQKTVVVEDR